MGKNDPPPDSVAPARRSRSAAASRRAEMRRIERMTVEERIRAALTMSRRFAWLQPTARTMPDYRLRGLDDLIAEARSSG